MSELAAFHRRLCLEGPRSWYESALLAALLPLGWLYGVIGRIRAKLYDWKLLPSYRAPVPVISVGNLSAGGTGKTPVVDYLVRRLLRQGLRVAVVSRGYGGRGVSGALVVSSGAGPAVEAARCGDEPFLLARRNPEALVVVAAKRKLGVRLAVEELGAQVVVLDDGFQHHAVRRDLNIVLVDAAKPFGNGHPLPAGLLREFPSALKRGQLFILTRWQEGCALPNLPGPVLRSRHVLASQAFDLEGRVVALETLCACKVVAFAGIAAPEGFFRDLRRYGLNLVRTLALPDHVDYDEGVLQRLRDASAEAEIFITTEKDAVKLKSDGLPLPCRQVPLVLEFMETAALDEALERLTADLSSH
ncbi:tetraacyldisaccharide 4'-kinase [Geoalkalibacter halelectricus]|uniref:Tetraacyldisaccharide 4'-kinase n=1 Tax=Geoalkalibacter halelectricus TaxID=2847045 RepID=A0ABY5ZGZ3_9BACT|nr:tetraacyldisaccharide 4'-kinase [Geoalkalibacter halelectricus]MDO3379571.1 tetraacyldisaccharide 4'-kinase [Geoalkalibacter halelectricus]UWZ78159.1 tetraacyldisaccharide 4'-kinase [Geoalkalibacter halelectricus]